MFSDEEQKDLGWLGRLLLIISATVWLLLAYSTYKIYATPEIESHLPNYVSFQDHHDDDYKNIHFQLSLKTKVLHNLNLSYTQKSWWDIYESSSPFRETNYNPSLFFEIEDMSFGYEHESNGMAGSNSRSWERLFLTTGFRQGKAHLEFKTWFPFFIHENRELIEYYGTWESTVSLEFEKISFLIKNRVKSTQMEVYYNVGDFYLFLQSNNGFSNNGLVDFDKPTFSRSFGVALTK